MSADTMPLDYTWRTASGFLERGLARISIMRTVPAVPEAYLAALSAIGAALGSRNDGATAEEQTAFDGPWRTRSGSTRRSGRSSPRGCDCLRRRDGSTRA